MNIRICDQNGASYEITLPSARPCKVGKTWVKHLERALPWLWSGLVPNYRQTSYICHAIRSNSLEVERLRNEISERLGNQTFEMMCLEQLGGWPPVSVVQEGRRLWILELIKEFRGEQK